MREGRWDIGAPIRSGLLPRCMCTRWIFTDRRKKRVERALRETRRGQRHARILAHAPVSIGVCVRGYDARLCVSVRGKLSVDSLAWVTNSWWLAPLSWLLPVPSHERRYLRPPISCDWLGNVAGRRRAPVGIAARKKIRGMFQTQCDPGTSPGMGDRSPSFPVNPPAASLRSSEYLLPFCRFDVYER